MRNRNGDKQSRRPLGKRVALEDTSSYDETDSSRPDNGEACSVRCAVVDDRAVSFQFYQFDNTIVSRLLFGRIRRTSVYELYA